jgi:putative transposase
MVDHPRAYRWSSYRAHAGGAADALLSEHAIYRAPEQAPAQRAAAIEAAVMARNRTLNPILRG